MFLGEIANLLLVPTIGLFILGAIHGLLMGRKDVHWLVRMMVAGALFGAWFITIPYIIYHETR